jgi:hypothetical protein
MDLAHGHAILGQGSGLVGADDGGRAQRLDRGEIADQDLAARHALCGQDQCQGQRRQQALGDQCDDDADGEYQVAPGRHTDPGSGHEEQDADRDRQQRDQPAQAGELAA